MSFFAKTQLLLSLTEIVLVAAVQFQEPTTTFGEAEGIVELTVARDASSASNSDSVTVSILTVEQFAMRDRSSPSSCQLQAADLGLADSTTFDPAEASDFSGGDVNVSFGVGVTSARANLEIMEDLIAERQEVLVAVLASDGSNCATVVHITDNDVVKVSFNEAKFDVTLVSGNFSEMMITKTGSNEPDFSISIVLGTSTATENLDFILFQTSFAFTRATDNLVVPIEILDDNITESIEEITICLPNAIRGTPISVEAANPRCSTITLLDNDVIFVGFPGRSLTNPRFTITEGNTEFLPFGVLGRTILINLVLEVSATLTRVGGGSTDVRLMAEPDPVYGITLGPAPSGYQFGSTFIVVNGSAVAIQNNVIDGTAVYNLTLQLGGATISQTQPVELAAETALVYILDDDRHTFTLGPVASNLVLREGDNNITIDFTITKSAEVSTVTYIITVGVQQSQYESDFIFVSNSFLFEPSMTSLTGSISVTDDRLPEGMESYDVVVTNIEPSVNLSISPAIVGSIPVTIIDNDFEVGFTGSKSMVSVTEGNSTTLNLGILGPALSELDPTVSLSLRLTLVKQNDDKKDDDDKVLKLRSPDRVVLTPTSHNTSVLLSYPDDDVCIEKFKYILAFEYIGSDKNNVFSNNDSIIVEVLDNDDCGGVPEKLPVCVVCIAVPVVIIIFLLLLCLLCLLFLLFWCCCKEGSWHTYDARKRENKFGELRDSYS